MIRFLVVFLFCLYSLQGNAQSSCSMVNTSGELKAGIAACGVPNDYTVYPIGYHTPIKYLRVSFNVFFKSDGSGSFYANEQTLKNYFHVFIDSVNFRLANMRVLYPSVSSQNVIDSRIRLQYNETYIYKDDNLYNYVTPYGQDIAIGDYVYDNVI